jgi:hypothetical protein
MIGMHLQAKPYYGNLGRASEPVSFTAAAYRSAAFHFFAGPSSIRLTIRPVESSAVVDCLGAANWLARSYSSFAELGRVYVAT